MQVDAGLALGFESSLAGARSGFRALVIGNNSYRHMRPLTKCINDATAMKDLLDRKGYHVTLLTDATSEAFRDRLRIFADSLLPGDVVVVHFAGHGLQHPDGNRLVFVDEFEEGDGEKVCAACGALSPLKHYCCHPLQVTSWRPSCGSFSPCCAAPALYLCSLMLVVMASVSLLLLRLLWLLRTGW